MTRIADEEATPATARPSLATAPLTAIAGLQGVLLMSVAGRYVYHRVELYFNGVDLDNEEQGAPIWVATDRLAPWSEIWPELRRLG